MARKITKTEIKTRAGYLLLGFFTYYLVEPVRDYINNILHVNPVIVGVVGIATTLYLFEF